ncbi:STOX1 protein, partial [Trogon melanurus]|nr:STOX1 protein [Trogon melanurus]
PSGDVTPALMNPLSQWRSIPLAEGICRTVSVMNADHVTVTQETLTEQLLKNYPGIAVPSHNTFYNILGTLIKERKIYHTGEGYFIVTPNTYCTTDNAAEHNGQVLLEDSCCCSLPSTTYLVNIERCAGLLKENIPAGSHYRSCCFPAHGGLSEQRHRPLTNHEPNGGGKKSCSELKPLIPAQGISTPAETHPWDTIKSLTSVKEKLKSKKFGLGFFWRSASKKEKRKKEYSTFSAQFPPKEWPVRDEDDLDNIPRDIEHEIIKRINPALTVDNLIKHTILMEKSEEQKNCIGKGTSAEASVVRQSRLLEDCVAKTQSKTAKHTRKTKAKEEKQISRSSRKSHMCDLTSPNEKLEENLSVTVRNQVPPEVAVESHVIYKKQIKNPFQGLSRRRNFSARGHKGTAIHQLGSGTQKPERDLQRPRSLDSSKTKQPASETQAHKVKQNKLLHATRSSLQLKKDSLSEKFSYPQGSTLQIDNGSECVLESNIPAENIYRRPVQKNPGDTKKSPCSYTEDNGVCKEDTQFLLHLKEEYHSYKADTELLDQAASEFQSARLSNCTDNVNLAEKNGDKYRQKTDKKGEFIFEYDCASHPGSMKLESEGFTDNRHHLHQKAGDGDACTSLRLDDNFEGSELCHLAPGRASSDTRGCSKAGQKLGTPVSPKTGADNACPSQYSPTGIKLDSEEHGCKESARFAESTGGSREHPEADFAGGSCLCSQVLPAGRRKEEETGPAEGAGASAEAGFCHTNEANVDTGAPQNFTCALGSRTKETGNPLGKNDVFFKNACVVMPGQKYSEGTENHSVTGDSGIDSPR